jgi:uncharacterized protein
LTPFVPLFKNPHLQTIAAHYWPRPSGGRRRPIERKLYRTEPDVQVLVESERPAGAPRGEIVLVHGLEGSADAGYMHSISCRALEAGYAVHRLNLRSCGGTEHLASTVYHGGLTSDLLAVLRALAAEGCAPLWLVGFSLGGNLVAKLAGELGDDAPSLLAGVCAASAAIDLSVCAARIGQPDNRLYEYRFLAKMRARAKAVWRSTPADLRGIRSVVEMDNRITAPRNGFDNAEHYYSTQSAGQFLERIRVPTLFIAAKDDTFIPFSIYQHPAFLENPCLELLATEHGGHLGFLAKGPHRLWLDHAIIKWITDRGTIAPPGSSG